MKPRRLSHRVGFFAVLYSTLLLLLMLQRLDSDETGGMSPDGDGEKAVPQT